MSFIGELIAASDLLDNCFTLANVDSPNQPAIHANSRFLALTGYRLDEVLGRNFRFLQGPLTSRWVRKRLREAIARRLPIHQDLVNYTKDDRPFWNRMVLLPLEAEGRHYYFGMQLDITKEKSVAAGRDLAVLTPREATHLEIGHRIRNPLSVISAKQHMAYFKRPEERRQFLFESTRNATEQIAAFVRSLPFQP